MVYKLVSLFRFYAACLKPDLSPRNQTPEGAGETPVSVLFLLSTLQVNFSYCDWLKALRGVNSGCTFAQYLLWTLVLNAYKQLPLYYSVQPFSPINSELLLPVGRSRLLLDFRTWTCLSLPEDKALACGGFNSYNDQVTVTCMDLTFAQLWTVVFVLYIL